MIKLASLWEKKSRNGKTYYVGKLGSGMLLLFRNEGKDDSKDPDLILYLAEDRGKGKAEGSEVPF